MDEIERFKKIQDNIEEISSKKIRLDERYRAQRAQLESLISEITSKGFDPKKLSETRQQKEEELKQLLDKLEKDIFDLNEKLKAIEE